MSLHLAIEDRVARANAALKVASAAVSTEPAWDDYIGAPGVRSRGLGTSEAELAFAVACAEFTAAARARHSYIYGPALREYYSREVSP